MERKFSRALALSLSLSLAFGLCVQTAAATEPEGGEENLVSYVAVKEDELTQTVAVGLVDEVSDITLTVEDTVTGEQTTYAADQLQDGLAGFTISGGEEVSLVSLQYTQNGEEESLDLSEAGLNPVEEEPDAYVEEDELSLEVLDLTSNATATQSALEVAMEDEKLVVVLDPGHDSTHAGAEGTVNGRTYHEEELTLKIAQYCKAELEQYQGVEVYMTRTTAACPNGGSGKSSVCNEKRADYAASVDADYYIAIHINSADTSAAKGVEVYYPNANYKPEMNTYGQGMANSILKQLADLGMTNRGAYIQNSKDNTLYPDGSLADYYGLIRNPKLRNICGLIIEHGFITNASDVQKYLGSDTALQKLGVADATGIANYLDLSKTQDNTTQYINTDPNKFKDDLGKGNWTWASSAIYACVEKGVIAGYPDHTFGIDDQLTREQAARIIDLAFGLTTGEKESLTFTDEDQIQSWAAESVDRCVTNGIISGYPDGSFRPQDTITRAEFSAMLTLAAGLLDSETDETEAEKTETKETEPTETKPTETEPTETKSTETEPADTFTFPDDNGQGNWAWASAFIYACYEHGIIKGCGDGCFHPEWNVTRGQAARMIALAAGFVTE